MAKIDNEINWNEIEGNKCLDELHCTPLWLTVYLI